MTFGIVVVSWMKPQVTRDCFQSLINETNEPFTLYWVQNEWRAFSNDNLQTERLLVRSGVQFDVIKNPANEGFTRAVNQGVSLALEDGHEFVTLLNNDTLVVPNWHRRMIAHMPPKCGAIAPLADDVHAGQCAKGPHTFPHRIKWLRNDNYKTYDRRLPRDASPRWFKEKPFISYCCVAIRREAWEQVGLLDERFGKAYGEDNDHCIRLKMAGWKIGIATAVCIGHRRSSSSKTLQKQTGVNRQQIGRQQTAILEAKWAEGHPPEGHPPDPTLRPWLPYD